MTFGIPLLDDHSVQKTLAVIAPVLARDICIMELRSNLVRAQRKSILSRYPARDFKRVAVVAMGEPSSEFKSKSQELILADKKRKAEREKAQKQKREKVKRAREEN